MMPEKYGCGNSFLVDIRSISGAQIGDVILIVFGALQQRMMTRHALVVEDDIGRFASPNAERRVDRNRKLHTLSVDGR